MMKWWRKGKSIRERGGGIFALLAIFLSFLLPIIHNSHAFAITDEQCQGYNNLLKTVKLPEGCICESKTLSYQEAASLPFRTGASVFTNCKAKASKKAYNDKMSEGRQKMINQALEGVCSAVNYNARDRCLESKGINTNDIIECGRQLAAINDNPNIAGDVSTCTKLKGKGLKTDALGDLYNEMMGGAQAAQKEAEEEARAEAGAEGTEETPCEKAMEEFAWVACPAHEKSLTMAQDIYDSILSSLLDYDVLAKGNDDLRNKWASFLPLGNIVLAIVFLVMIYSMATSTGMSNYTIKKAMPRLIVAAIAINLSFYLCALVVDLSNIIGANIVEFLAPNKTGLDSVVQNGEDFALAGTTAVITVLAILFGILSTSVLVLGALVFFGLLALRTILITLLIILSPIACALYLLPNTQKWFNMYIKEFSRLLIAYPLAAGVFGGALLVEDLIDWSQTGWVGIIGKPLLMLAPIIAVFPILKMSGAVASAVSQGGRLKNKYNNTAIGKARAQARKDAAAERRAGMARTDHRGILKPLNKLNVMSNKITGSNMVSRGFDRFAPGYNATRSLEAAQAQNRAYTQEEEAMTAQKYSKDQLVNMVNTGTHNGRKLTEVQRRVAIKLSAELMDGTELQDMIEKSKQWSDNLRSEVAEAINKNSKAIPFAGSYGQKAKIAAGTYDKASAMSDYIANKATASGIADMDTEAQKQLFAHALNNPVEKSMLQDTVRNTTQNTFNTTSAANRQNIRDFLNDPNFSGVKQEVVIKHDSAGLSSGSNSNSAAQSPGSGPGASPRPTNGGE